MRGAAPSRHNQTLGRPLGSASHGSGARRMPAIRIDHRESSVGPAAKRAEVQMRRPAASGVA